MAKTPELRFVCLMAWVMPLTPLWGETPATPPPSATEEARTVSNALLRDPFWPVGYAPARPSASDISATPESVATATEEDWEQARKRLVATSVFRVKNPATGADRMVALIGGRVVAPGEILSVKHRNMTFRFKVSCVTADGPEFERVVEE